MAALALAAFLLFPAVARAQGADAGKSGSGDPPASGGDTDIANKHVALDVENKPLHEVIPDLMKKVGADYAIDNSVKDATVSIHLPDARFQAALDTLLKVCSVPVMYKLEDGVYHIMPRVEAPEPAPTRRGPAPKNALRGPLYTGGSVFEVATTELVQFLTGSELEFSGARNRVANGSGGSSQAGSGSLGGFRNYSNYGFINGHFSSSSYVVPDVGAPPTTTYRTGGGINFGPIHLDPNGHPSIR